LSPGPTKRFWDTAQAQATADGWIVALDGRSMRLPGGTPLLVQSAELADALAAEWAAAGGARGNVFGPADLPLTRITGTMIERVGPQRDHVLDTLAAYAESDLLSYRAAPYPDPLMPAKQAAQWDPWAEWVSVQYGLDLPRTQGVMPLPRAPELVRAARDLLAARSDAVLAALGVAIPALGSFVLGLALADGALDAAQAVRVATVDEESQLAVWGEDAEQRARLAMLASDVADAARFMSLAAQAK